MKRCAIVNSESLLGNALKEALGRRRDLFGEVSLVSSAPDVVGTVTEGTDGAALVQEATPELLDGIDVVFVCPGPEVSLGASAAAVYLSPELPVHGALSLVAGLNLERIAPGAPLVSPSPAVIALAHLLAPLRPLGLARAVCWVLQPTSAHGQRGIDELLEQTRSILSFQSSMPKEVFGGQLAFNVLPTKLPGDQEALELNDILGSDELKVDVQSVQAAVFHSLAFGAHVRLERSATVSEVGEALRRDAFIESAEAPSGLGPIDVAGQAGLKLGEIRSAPGAAHSFWLWAAMDNITAEVDNALAIAEALP